MGAGTPASSDSGGSSSNLAAVVTPSIIGGAVLLLVMAAVLLVLLLVISRRHSRHSVERLVPNTNYEVCKPLSAAYRQYIRHKWALTRSTCMHTG